MTLSQQHEPIRSIRKHVFVGILVTCVLTFGVGGWAIFTNISGAVIAPGLIVVAGNVQKVQHPDGGVVGEIHARDGDEVKAGDVLLRLDATITRANLAMINKSLIELTARRARLVAERDEEKNVLFPAVLKSEPNDPLIARIVAGEEKLFQLRQLASRGQREQLQRRIEQLLEQTKGLMKQANAKSKEIKLIDRELEGARSLYKKGLMPISKLTQLERSAARLEGEEGQLIASISGAKVGIAETELQIMQINRDLASQVADELQEADAKIGELEERKVAAQEKLSRIDIRAPQSGMVHQSKVHTVGGVIQGGDEIMLIVPKNSELTIEAKVAPQHIDQLQEGQQTMLRLSALNQRTTPEFAGTLAYVSADISVDQASGTSYYTIRVDMDKSSIEGIARSKLVPGMPVEVFVRTGDRNVISYLIKPIRDQLMRAFREE